LKINMKRTLPPQPERIPLTQQGYDKIVKEQEELLSQRPDAIFHLQKSRELGICVRMDITQLLVRK